MEYFIKIFGELSIGQVTVVIAALIFLLACYKKVEKYFREKTVREVEKDKEFQNVIKQVESYPAWHRQSMDDIKELSNKIDTINSSMEEMRTETSDERATNWRYRILRFNDEVLHDERHTKEHFDQILEDISKYEKYCDEHQNYKNSKAEMAVKNIKRVYEKCSNDGTFL